MKLEITNTSRAPQGVHATDGVKFVPQGETRTLDISQSWLGRLHQLEDAGLLSVKDPELVAAAERQAVAAREEQARIEKEDAERIAAEAEAERQAAAESDAEEQRKKKDEADQFTTAQGQPGAIPPNLPEGKPGDPPQPCVRAEARHLGGGRWGIFLGDERFGDETYSKDEAAAEVDKLNAPLNTPIEQKAE